MPAKVNGFSLAYTATGAVVLWSGIKGTSIADTFRGLLSGKAPSGTTEPISGSDAAGTAATGAAGAAGAAAQAAGDTAAHSLNASANQSIARLLTAPYGWSAGTQWADLVSLWNQESGWSATAQNGSSGAYGIPQALPYTKMPKAAWPPADGGSASATTQIAWGLSYIKGRYGSPEAAWAHEQSAGWY
jgi:hypothetical protein